MSDKSGNFKGSKASGSTGSNDRTELFLDLYKKLEQLLRLYYKNDTGRFDSFVTRYENSKECGELMLEIKSIREIRNLLQHNPKCNGNYIVTPSDDMIKTLKEVIHRVEHPRLAIDFGVRDKNIYKATLNTPLIKVLKVMKERGFSHVPIIENGVICGVLSAYSVFEFVTEQGMQIVTEETKVNAMRDYLPFQKQRNEYYRFMPKDAAFFDADEAFEKRDNKGRRLVAIFITEHGNANEPLLAMLTPWSVVGK